MILCKSTESELRIVQRKPATGLAAAAVHTTRDTSATLATEFSYLWLVPILPPVRKAEPSASAVHRQVSSCPTQLWASGCGKQGGPAQELAGPPLWSCCCWRGEEFPSQVLDSCTVQKKSISWALDHHNTIWYQRLAEVIRSIITKPCGPVASEATLWPLPETLCTYIGLS